MIQARACTLTSDPHDPPRPSSCHLCHLFTTHARYNELWGGSGIDITPALSGLDGCRHLGEETGETEQCKTCSGTVKLKIFSCGHPDIKTTTLKNCKTCKFKIKPRVWRFDHTDLYPNWVPGRRFNSSLTRCGDEYLLAFRNGWCNSNIFVATLDPDMKPLSVRQLPLYRACLASYGREDPRFFWFRGKLHVEYIGVSGPDTVTNVMYARLGDDLGVEEIFYPHYEHRLSWEKNWGFFEHDDQLYAIYSIRPHRVLRIDGNKAMLVQEMENRFPWPGEMRGGACPVRVGDEFWSFFHARQEAKDGHRIYNTGLYTFDAKPPFAPRRIVRRPLMVADRSTNLDNYASVVFPGGAVHEGDRWLLTSGVHDRWCEVREFWHRDLDKALEVR